MDEITIGDKMYISSKRAAEVTGYAKDYVGQLCREGHLDAKMVGRSWYVYEPSIRAHRFGEAAVTAVPGSISFASEDLGATVSEPREAPHTVERVAESVIAPVNAPVSTPNTDSETATPAPAVWEAANYTLEAPQMLPELQAPAYEELLPPGEETLTDMQEAWKEWFQHKQDVLSTPELESPQVLDARYEAAAEDEDDAEEETQEQSDDEDIDQDDDEAKAVEEEADEVEEHEGEEEVVLHRIQSTPEADEERIPIRQIPASVSVYEAAPSAPRRVSVAQQYQDHLQAPARIIEERIVRRAGSQGEGSSVSPRAKAKSSYAPAIALLVGVSVLAIAIGVIGSGYMDSYIRSSHLDNPIFKYLVGTREYIR